LINLEENRMRKLSWITLILAIGLVLSGCGNQSAGGEDQEFRVRTGQWSGAGDGGNFSVTFTVGTDGANIFILMYAVPCNDQSMYVMPSNPIKISVTENAFAGEVEQMSLTGRFIDKTHVEGTWKALAHEVVPYSGEGCEMAQGTWKGKPD